MQPRRLLGTEVSLPQPKYGNGTLDSYFSDNDFDTNMVLILASLLCVLVFALVLNSMVRCARRCSRRLSPDTREQSTVASLATSGLKKRDLEQIPVAVFGTGLRFTSTECPICLGEFEDGEKHGSVAVVVQEGS
ncbi:Arabidopsis Toxicos en Levadura 72, DAF-Like gene 1 [Hibiscus trionum]|uniref:RING-type E3 ubiquitin transferase n=1 Tax=Hibiscus trionum TaxID=183268 RepID=A0A9W7LW20_HIBTR|nr:Arabidopsis Toxicos en Levadura 72, DAF-Like gene 1 [Hibiscus trionum]